MEGEEIVARLEVKQFLPEDSSSANLAGVAAETDRISAGDLRRQVGRVVKCGSLDKSPILKEGTRRLNAPPKSATYAGGLEVALEDEVD